MRHLTETTVDDLRNALENVDGKKPTQRLIVAIAYKHGVTQSELANWFDVERKTIYNWLTRLENRNFVEAVRDNPRPGRPRKLSPDDHDELERILRSPPTEIGCDTPAWTTSLVQEVIRERFDVEYSQPSCRRLMKAAGLSHQTPRIAAVEAKSEDSGTLAKELKKASHVWIPE